MSSKLDRYSTSYLLSGYAFNDFKLRNHVDSRSQEDSDDKSLCSNEEPTTAIDEQQQPSQDGSRLLVDGSHAHGSGYDIIGAHGLGREEVRVSSFEEHGVHGPIQEAARVSDRGVQHAARVSDHRHAKRSFMTRVIGGDQGTAVRVHDGGEHGTAAGVHGGSDLGTVTRVIGGGDLQTAARVFGGGNHHTASRVIGGGDHQTAARQMGSEDHGSTWAAARVIGGGDHQMLAPLVQSAQMGNKMPSSQTGNLGGVPKSGNNGFFVGTAATVISGNPGLGNLTAGTTFAQILNSGNSGHNASNVTEDDQDAISASFIAPESSKPSIKGRIFLSKGDSPWKLPDLKFKLQSVWQLPPSWRLISLGKGFFHILLPSEEDKNKVWGMGSLNLKPRVLRLQPWFPNFNPSTQGSTNAQVWVRFHELPWVYWDRQILSDLARGVGVPIRFDEMTLKGEFGHFARILIDIDLSQPISDSLMVEVGNDCLFIPLEYERLPAFCSSCKIIGHTASSCRRGHKPTTAKESDSRVDRGRSQTRKQVYRPITKSPLNPEVPVKNAFSALRKDLGAENPNLGETSMGGKKLWADVADEALEVDNRVEHRNKENETLLHAEGQHNSLHAVDRDLAKENDQGHTNIDEHINAVPDTDVVSVDDLEDKRDTHPQQVAIGSDIVPSIAEDEGLNTSDLSPTKVFETREEGWQEVQSKRKKKAQAAQ
ncbi:Zinc knuckle CX2CX4HX4C, partial [Trema orientale]